MAKKGSELVAAPSEEALAALREQFPAEPAFQRVSLPRIVFKSQDVTEGEGKKKKVVIEAGTFFEEKETDEEIDVLDEKTGKKVGTKKKWESIELGNTIEGTIVFKRKQLKLFNEQTERFLSTPIYDGEDEILPLRDGTDIVERGTPAELKAKYEFVDEKSGKTKSKLEEHRILYILLDGVLHQLNLRGSSMYSFLTYSKTTLVPSVLTVFTSEPQKKGKVEWNQMQFEAKRDLSAKEVEVVLEQQNTLKEDIVRIKAFFAARDAAEEATGLADEFRKK